jgi:PAS domain S-box-containing protein
MSKKNKKNQNERKTGTAGGGLPFASESCSGPSGAALEAYNNLEATQRAKGLERLGVFEEDSDILGILTKSHFVIPGKTRFECQRCGECCRYARKVAQLTYDPCPFLTGDNTCAKHDDRYLVCKWFPFWIYNSPRFGPMLTIKPYCTGFGKGALVDYRQVVERIGGLASAEKQESDGAFVIHEVLFVPGRKDWAFPSKGNVDSLMSYIMHERLRSAGGQAEPLSAEKRDEVHYAHHYTSGLLGSINSPLITVNEGGIVTDSNEAASVLFKRDRPALIGKLFSSFFVNRDRVAASLDSCLSHGKETASPQRLRLPDETTLPVLLNGSVFRDRCDGLVHGSLVCVSPVSAAVFSDVSHSRTYARGLLEASLDALMVIDHDGTITDVNEALVKITGLSRTRLTGSLFKDLFVDAEKAKQGVGITFRDDSVRAFELDLRDINGEVIPVSFNATVYRDEEGVVQGIFAAARDIRERRKMIHELEDARNYARGLIECCMDLMVTISRDGVITDVNKAATGLTGVSREKLIGAPFRDFFDNPELAQKGVERTFSQGEVRGYEINLVDALRRKIPVSFNASLYRDSRGAVQGVFAVARVK